MTILNKFVKTAVAVAAVSVAGLASANVLVNGSFELGTIPNPRLSDGGTTLPIGSTAVTGWTVIDATVDWLQTNTVSSNAFTAWELSPQEGNRFMDLTGLSSGPYGGVQQSFPTIVGLQYDISFWLGSTNTALLNTGQATTLLAVGTAPILTATTLFDPTPAGKNKWEQRTGSFVATGTTSTLSFTGVSGFNYIGLDNVVVTAIPEPGTVALMLAGLAAVGSIAARRRPQR